MCDKYTLKVQNKQDNLTYEYYFARKYLFLCSSFVSYMNYCIQNKQQHENTRIRQA